MATIYYYLKGKRVSKKEIRIEKHTEFFKYAIKLAENENLIYRGINDTAQLYPKIIRETDYSKCEEKIFEEFEKYYGLYSNVSNFWEFAALAQHHGLYTRLIDFSRNIFVAAFFSLYRKTKDRTYKIYVFNQRNFLSADNWNNETSLISEPDDTRTEELIVAFRNLEKTGSSYLLAPSFSNNRMFVQQGLFVVPGNLSKDYINKLYSNADLVITISPMIRRHILRKLKILGYDEYRLMPDLDSVCKEINSECTK